MIGLGYVGLPLVTAFSNKGFSVVGFDIDPEKIEKLKTGVSYIKHLDASKIKEAIDEQKIEVTFEYSDLKKCDVLLICVPTPLTSNREPDMSYVENTGHEIGKIIQKNQLVCLESTTYPGTSREVLIPAIEMESELNASKDFFVAYSPEREDPNNAKYNTSNIPKLVGGVDEVSGELATLVYRQVIEEVIPVSSSEVAEAAKILENVFRSVNIAMVNELKVVFQRMGIDIWEVIEAAKTKPFGFMPFYPGPGLGGHCIPIDPFYLTWKAREYDTVTRFIELAGEINTNMPYYVVLQTMEALNQDRKSISGSKILLVGMAYKPNIDDLRESPALRIFQLLKEKGADVSYHDPYIPEIKPTREYPQLQGIQSVDLSAAKDMDAVIIVTNHQDVDYEYLAQNCSLIVDTRNALNTIKSAKARIVKS